jgi:DNA-binding NarL/FixJ family response regulator
MKGFASWAARSRLIRDPEPELPYRLKYHSMEMHVMNRIRILLADDHGVVRQGLRAILERQPAFEIVGETGDGRDAVALSEALDPHIVIMDIVMPRLNGIEATSQIVRESPRTRVIILSMHSDETYLLRAITAGAKGYLLKDSAEVDLVRAVQAVSEGKPFFSPEITRTLLDDYMRYLQQRNLEDSYELLTYREKEVLQLLAEGKSNKDVATALDLSTYTVESHRTNLMRKLGLHNTAELVLYAVRKKIIS